MPRLAMSGAANASAFGFNKLAQAVNDAYFSRNVLLLPGNGTNGAQNNTFLDSSSNNFTITRNGNTTQGTFSPFSQTGWSNYFDGSSYLSFASSANLAISTSDYTLECWVYVTTLSNGTVYGAAASGGPVFNLNLASGNISLNPYGSGNTFSGSFTFAVGNWYHIAFARASNSLKVFVNGTQIGTTTTDATNYTQTAMSVASAGGIQNFTGYVSNLRFVKGTAVYTSNFTPPTSPLTAITNTQLLTCQSNRFIDNSSNAFAITVNGTPSVQAFSPFAPTAAYSAATNGGSGYFDGTGDYLVTASSANLALGTSDFTYETWFYPTAAGGSKPIAYQYTGANGGFIIYWNTSTIRLLVAAPGAWAIDVSTSTIPLNAWCHVALVRSGTTFYLFVNGAVASTSTGVSGTLGTSAIQFGIGGNPGGSEILSSAYLAGSRLVKGTAVYTAAFTPPTAPPTNITNTQLLLNFTNAGILDATGKNVLETVGNAQISTTQSKWGGSSMYFDGIGDSVITQAGQTGVFGTGDFTIEGWFRWDSIASLSGVVWSKMSTSSMFWTLYIYPANKLLWGNRDSNILTSTTTLSTGTWYHVAITRQSGTVKMWINGTLEGSATDTSNYNVVGSVELGNSHGGNYFTGYIDDFRITRGLARYAANFTPPTAAFALQ